MLTPPFRRANPPPKSKDFPMRSRLISFTVALAVVIMFVGIKFAASQGADPVLAKVNGAEIHQSDLAVAEAEIGGNIPAEAKGDARRDALLAYLIEVNLLSQLAETKKVDQLPTFPQRLDFARKRVMVDTLMAEETKNISDNDIKKFYDDNVKPIPEVHARHILVETEAQAKDIATKLKAGEDFVKLAKENSKDPGSSDGGDLGYITKDKVVPEFGDAAFKLEKGKISDPVKSQFGWHIIKVEDKRVSTPPPLDALKGRIKLVLMQKVGDDLMTKAQETAKIERFTQPTTPTDGNQKK
jgi:peptidyl-prolyl cis-trans isomerase C